MSEKVALLCYDRCHIKTKIVLAFLPWHNQFIITLSYLARHFILNKSLWIKKHTGFICQTKTSLTFLWTRWYNVKIWNQPKSTLLIMRQQMHTVVRFLICLCMPDQFQIPIFLKTNNIKKDTTWVTGILLVIL